MFKFDQCAPDIAARVEAERAHQEACTLETCERCGRWPRPTPLSDEQLFENWARPALTSLPAAFTGATFDAEWLGRLVGEANLKKAREATQAPRVALFGLPGTGKTSLVVAMFTAALRASKRDVWRKAEHLYVSAHGLAKARAMHPLGQGEAPLVARSLNAPLLVIDELGGEDARHASAVAEVIYERHAEDMPTWVTTGVDPAKLADRYGGGIARRLFEGAVVFKLVRKS